MNNFPKKIPIILNLISLSAADALNVKFFNLKGTKRPNQKTEYTSEMLQEYIKCSHDPIYFAENYYYVNSTHNNKGKQIVKLYDFQKEILYSLMHNNNNIL